MEQIGDILKTAIEYGIGPAFVLFVGWHLNRKNEKRAETVKQALEANTGSNSADHNTVVARLDTVVSELKAHREEFTTYTEAHAREHQLINRIIAH